MLNVFCRHRWCCWDLDEVTCAKATLEPPPLVIKLMHLSTLHCAFRQSFGVFPACLCLGQIEQLNECAYVCVEGYF